MLLDLRCSAALHGADGSARYGYGTYIITALLVQVHRYISLLYSTVQGGASEARGGGLRYR